MTTTPNSSSPPKANSPPSMKSSSREAKSHKENPLLLTKNSMTFANPSRNSKPSSPKAHGNNIRLNKFGSRNNLQSTKILIRKLKILSKKRYNISPNCKLSPRASMNLKFPLPKRPKSHNFTSSSKSNSNS